MKNTDSILTLAQKAALITRLLDHIQAECKEVDTESAYDEMLDDCYDLSTVGGPFSGMSASRVLREVDPTAYRCGFSDWLDGEDYTEIDGSYYRNDDIEDARDSFVADLQTELDEAQTELDELEEQEEEDSDPDGITEARATVARLEAQIEAVEDHTF